MTDTEHPTPARSARYWPARPADLVDTALCPSCFRPLGADVCVFCGLDLRTPRSSALLELGREMLTTEARRQAVIGEIRSEAAGRSEAARLSEATRLSGVTSPSDAAWRSHPAAPPRPPMPPQDASVSVAPETSWALPTPPRHQPEPDSVRAPMAPGVFAQGVPIQPASVAPRTGGRSAGQVLILTAGVVLVSVFAIFFAVVAYLVASVEFRSILTAVASLVVLAVAWLLRRRRLEGTAEGIAVIGVVLLLLDVWIIRLNGLFGVERLDSWLYTGFALSLLVAVLVGISRLTGVRAPSVSAAVVAPVAAFTLVIGLSSPVASESTRALLGAVAAMALVVASRLPALPRPESTILRVESLVAGLVAVSVAAFSFPSLIAGSSVAFSLAVVGWLVVGLSVLTPSRSVWSVLSGIGLSLASVGLAIASADAVGQTSVVDDALRPVSLGVVVVAAIAGARAGSAGWRSLLRLVAALVGGTAALALVVPAGTILVRLAETLIAPAFRSGAFDPTDARGESLAAAALGVLGVAVLATGALALHGSRRVTDALGWSPVVAAAVAVVGGALSLPSAAASVSLVVVTIAVLLGAAGWRPAPRSFRASSFSSAVALSLIGIVLATASAGVWLPATVATLLLLVGARFLAARGGVPGPRTSAVVAVTAAATTLLALGGILPSWLRSLGIAALDLPEGFGLTVAATVVLVALAFAYRRVFSGETIAIGSVSVLALLSGGTVVWADVAMSGDVGWRLLVSLCALAVVGAWAGASRTLGMRVAAAALGIPLLSLTAVQAVAFAAGPGLLGTAVLAGAAGVAAATSLVLVAALATVFGAARHTRALHPIPAGAHSPVAPASGIVSTTVDVALGVTGAIVLVATVADAAPLGPLALLVLAVTPTLIAFRPVDAAATPARGQLGWIGAALAVGALWWFLAERDVGVVEFYSLPVAGLLLAVAGTSTLAHRRPSPPDGRPVARLVGTEVVLSAAAGVAVLPSAALSADGDATRALVTTGIGAVLLVLTLAVVSDSALLRGRVIVGLASVIAVGLPLVVRSVGVTDGVGGVSVQPWLLVVAVVLLATAVTARRFRRSVLLAGAAATAAAISITITASTLIGRASIDPTLVVPWLLVLGTIAVVASTVARPAAPVPAIVASIGAVGLAAIALGTVPHVEYVSVPLGLAALLAGVLRLRSDPASRSWPMLAPGLLLILLPSLARDLGETTLWRIIAVGVLAVVVLLCGVLLRLQAPLVIGAVTVILHGLAQLWPWISGLYEAGYWWVWAGLGGVVLIVFAARYEQRVADLRRAGQRLRALR